MASTIDSAAKQDQPALNDGVNFNTIPKKLNPSVIARFDNIKQVNNSDRSAAAEFVKPQSTVKKLSKSRLSPFEHPSTSSDAADQHTVKRSLTVDKSSRLSHLIKPSSSNAANICNKVVPSAPTGTKLDNCLAHFNQQFSSVAADASDIESNSTTSSNKRSRDDFDRNEDEDREGNKRWKGDDGSMGESTTGRGIKRKIEINNVSSDDYFEDDEPEPSCSSSSRPPIKKKRFIITKDEINIQFLRAFDTVKEQYKTKLPELTNLPWSCIERLTKIYCCKVDPTSFKSKIRLMTDEERNFNNQNEEAGVLDIKPKSKKQKEKDKKEKIIETMKTLLIQFLSNDEIESDEMIECLQNASTSEGWLVFSKIVCKKCIELVKSPIEPESFDRAFSLTIQNAQKFLELGMKKEAAQLADCLSRRVDSFEFMTFAHQRLISNSKLFRYDLEIFKLSKKSSRIGVCFMRSHFQWMHSIKVQRLFRQFLDKEAREKTNKGQPNAVHWSNTDRTLVNDFISFLREEVSHRCKACADQPSLRFVNSFLKNSNSINYLLPGIDLMLFVGANPNEAIDENGNTMLHSIVNDPRLVTLDTLVPIAELLIEKGFNVNRVNNQNKTVLQLLSSKYQNRVSPALCHFLQTKNTVPSLKCLSALAVSQEDFDIIAAIHASTGYASEIPVKLVEFLKCSILF